MTTAFRTTLRALMVAVPAAGALAQNLLPNPGFEAGNTGFGTDYQFATGNCCEGQYTISATPSNFNGSYVNPPPSSPGSVLMMVINGATVPGLRTWFTTVPVTPGVAYHLSLQGCTAVVGGPAQLQWEVNGAAIGGVTELPGVTRLWVPVAADWTAPPGVTSALVVLRNRNESRFPNDFYIDDLSMAPACPADFNGDGFLDFFDYDDYVNCFETAACPPGRTADFNGDGFADFFDYDDFVAAFELGC